MLSSMRSRISPESEQCSKWEDLPAYLLKDIAKLLTSNSDYIYFRSVCTSWKSAATFDNFDTQFPRVPRLIHTLVEEGEEPRLTESIKWVNNTRKIIDFPPPTDFPYLSSYGWLLCLSKDSVNVALLHFIRRENIALPGLDTFPGYEERSQNLPVIRKMVLSTTPHLLVMVIWGDGEQLGFCRPGDESWTIMDKWDDSFSDIIYDDRKLYAVDSVLRIVECDIHGSSPTKIVKVFTFTGVSILDGINRFRSADRGCWVVHNYLVKSSDKFMIVCRYISPAKTTYSFRMFEIELKDGSYAEIRNLGKKCLFLGLNSSICAEFPESSSDMMNLIFNCIHFTNTIEQSGHPDTGVFELCDEDEDGCFVRLPFCFPQATMIVPTL